MMKNKKIILFGALFAAVLMPMTTAVATPLKEGANKEFVNNEIDNNSKSIEKNVFDSDGDESDHGFWWYLFWAIIIDLPLLSVLLKSLICGTPCDLFD